MTHHTNKENMHINLRIWRQKNKHDLGKFVDYKLERAHPDMSFLEMLDVLNEDLIKKGIEPVAFDHDCREGICGSCCMVINGDVQGPQKATTACQLHMRTYKDGDTIVIEPYRARAFPVIKDLVVDRGAFDRIVQAGGFISVNVGSAQDGNSIPVLKDKADMAFDAATCIACGACVAACPNGSASLYTSAQFSRLALLPQGQIENTQRVAKMVYQMDEEGFGSCTNIGACADACPKSISLENIAILNREFRKAMIFGRHPFPKKGVLSSAGRK